MALHPPPSRLAYRLLPVGLALAVVAAFGAIVFHDFIREGGHDDDLNILENPVFQQPSVDGFWRLWRGPYWMLYIPVAQTAWGALALLGRGLPQAIGPPGFNPHVFHAASLLLHGANVLLVFHILRRLVRDQVAAAAGALLFALHPMQVEPVCWASAIKDLLACLFCLLALRQALLTEPAAGVVAPGSLARGAVISGGLFALAVLAKPSALHLPVAALALLLLVEARPWPESLRAVGPWLLLLIPLAWITMPVGQSLWVEDPAPWRERPVVAADAVAFYVTKLVAPVGLVVDYARPPRFVMESRVSGMIAGITVFAGLLAVSTGSRILWASLVLYLAPILPVMGFVPFLQQNVSTVADRYTYQAMLGPALAMAGLLAWAARTTHRRAIPAAAALALLCLVPVDRGLASAWTDVDTLFSRCAALNPRSWLAYHARGVTALGRGDATTAEAYLRRALENRPAYWVSEQRLGEALDKQGRTEEAAEHKKTAENGLTSILLGQADRLGRAGKVEQAAQLYAVVLRKNPDNALAQERFLALAKFLDKRRPRSR